MTIIKNDFKLLDQDTDLSKLKMEKMPWDVRVHGKPFDVYRIDDYIHTIGPPYGVNDYWAIEVGKEFHPINFYEFSGHSCRWGFTINESNYVKCKWNESEIRSHIYVQVLRNDEIFVDFVVRDVAYAFAEAQKIITEAQEHPIPFNLRNYQDKIIDRKIYYRDQPAIITSYIDGQACVMIKPDNKTGIFRNPPHREDDDIDIEEDLMEVKEYIFVDHIWWFRE